jgi:hypothetical protein
MSEKLGDTDGCSGIKRKIQAYGLASSIENGNGI